MPAVLVCTRRLYIGVLGFSGRTHNIDGGYSIPCHTILLLYRINHFYLSYDTLQPALNNILMEIKEVWDRPGMTCARVVSLESHGRSKYPVYVDCSVFPSGICMTRVLVSG